MTALDDAISFHIHECKDPECNVSLAALDEIDSLRAKSKRAEAAESRAVELASLLRETLPELKESIDAIGDDHSVGICCCNLISLVDRISSALSGVPIYAEQDEPEERDELQARIDRLTLERDNAMAERDRANNGFAALSKEYDRAMTRLAAHGEKVTA